MIVTVFFPQKLQRHVRPTQLLVDVFHVRQGARRPLAVVSLWKQQRLKLLLVHVFGQRPDQSGSLGALQVFGNGGVSQPAAAGDLAMGESDLMLEAQDLGRFAHG